MPSVSRSSQGSQSFNIPNNGYNIQATVRGGRGGRGGDDAEADGGSGGTTTQQTFQFKSNREFKARSFTISVGGPGDAGEDNQPNAQGGSGGGGLASGGRGGNAGDPPYSGGGGGGGGASGVYDAGTLVIVMGGSGGGGGASDNANGGDGGAQSTNASSTSGVSSSSGGGGGDPGGEDGGGGGGGGGGSNGGGGGRAGKDNNYGGGGGSAGGSRYNINYCNAGPYGGGNSNSSGYVLVTWDEAAPQINSFSASPNPQNSTSGLPQYSTKLSWGTSYATSVTLTSNAGESWSYGGGTNSKNITNLPQSSVPGNSPAKRTYTLTASNDGGSVNSSVTVNARNDNTLSNSWTTSFSNLNPSTVVDLTIGTCGGIDMTTTVSASGAGNFVGSGGSFAGSKNFTNGQTVQLRTTTLPYNTDVSGETGIYGKTNSKTVSVSYPGGSVNITVTTAAPRIREDFDYADNIDRYPYEDIDLITNSPTEHLASAQITADDIEIPMEVKVDKPGAQVSINGGGWQNVRSI